MDATSAVRTLLWMGRILFVLGVIGFTSGFTWMRWVSVGLLLVFPLFVMVYWAGIRVKRPEVSITALLSLGLDVTFVIILLT